VVYLDWVRDGYSFKEGGEEREDEKEKEREEARLTEGIPVQL
jgi:hypothetical protein